MDSDDGSVVLLDLLLAQSELRCKYRIESGFDTGGVGSRDGFSGVPCGMAFSVETGSRPPCHRFDNVSGRCFQMVCSMTALVESRKRTHIAGASSGSGSEATVTRLGVFPCIS